MFVVVAYDIKDDRRRNRVLKEMKGWGVRVQYSVFECDLNEKQIERMVRRLRRIIKEEEDSIRVYLIREKERVKIRIIGQGEITRFEDVYVI